MQRQDALGSPLTVFARMPPGAGVCPAHHPGHAGRDDGLTASGKELAVEVSVSFERHAEGETTTVFARPHRPQEGRGAPQAGSAAARIAQDAGRGHHGGGIAHDFNNILGAILGNVELAKADCAPGSPVLESLLEIDKAGRRARDLVRQILTFSRNEPPQRTAVSLAEVVHDTERLLRVTLPPPLSCTACSCSRACRRCWPMPRRWSRRCLNLCTNAVHAIQGQGSERGSILVKPRWCTPDQRLESAWAWPHRLCGPDGARQRPGHGRATLERIFEPFFTTKPVGQGTAWAWPWCMA